MIFWRVTVGLGGDFDEDWGSDIPATRAAWHPKPRRRSKDLAIGEATSCKIATLA